MDYLRIAFKTKAEHDKYIKHQAQILGISSDDDYVSAQSLLPSSGNSKKKNSYFNRKVKNNFSRWTKEDDDFVVENYTKMSHSKIAKSLGRSTASVQSRVGILRGAGQIKLTKDLHGHIIRETT